MTDNLAKSLFEPFCESIKTEVLTTWEMDA